jgi:predicted nucleotidyltransferase
VGVVQVLAKALEALRHHIDVAFVYGSIAASSERSTSDIDLRVIGSATLAEIAPLLRGVEQQVGRAINPTIYQPDEFVRQIQRRNHFLKSALQMEPLFIYGGPDELAKLAARAKDKVGLHQSGGTQRPARPR